MTVVRPKHWITAETLKKALEGDLDTGARAEEAPATSPPPLIESNSKVTVSFWGLVISAAMIGAFVVRGAAGFASDFIAYLKL